MACWQVGVEFNPSLNLGKLRDRCRTTTPTPLGASLAITVAPAAVAVALFVMAVVESVVPPAGRAACPPATVRRTGPGTCILNGRHVAVLKASVASVVGGPRLLTGGMRALGRGHGRLKRRMGVRTAGTSHALDQGRNFVKRHSLVREGLNQHDLLLCDGVEADTPGPWSSRRGGIWVDCSGGHRGRLSTLTEHRGHGEGHRRAMSRLRGGRIRWRRGQGVRRLLLMLLLRRRLGHPTGGEAVGRCCQGRSTRSARVRRRVLASHVSKRLQNRGAVGRRRRGRGRVFILRRGGGSRRRASGRSRRGIWDSDQS